MTQLLNGVPQDFSAGLKCIDVRMSSGTAKLQISVDGSSFVDIENSDKSASANFNITVPDCQIQAVLTGDATAGFANIS